MKHGFTLIELAVVLVIIGLLIGGVLVGRDLINAATVKNFVNSIERYNAGASTFRVKYHSLPGDLTPATAELYEFTPRDGQRAHGDGNGLVEGCSLLAQKLGCETALFWRDMWDGHVNNFASSIATDIPVDGTDGSFKIENYLPGTPFRAGNSVFMYALNSRNSYYVTRISAVASDGTLTVNPALTQQEARDIDDKIDDAYPDNGIVRAMSALDTFDAGAADSTRGCVNNSLTNLAYNLVAGYTGDISCMISIRSPL
jgi:prepilin-type N-terminal cleavage/methylation domain-containing protein